MADKIKTRAEALQALRAGFVSDDEKKKKKRKKRSRSEALFKGSSIAEGIARGFGVKKNSNNPVPKKDKAQVNY